MYVEIDKDKAILEPASLIDELEDMIMKEMAKEGYTGEEAKAAKMKLEFSKALERELAKRAVKEDIPVSDALKELGLD